MDRRAGAREPRPTGRSSGTPPRRSRNVVRKDLLPSEDARRGPRPPPTPRPRWPRAPPRRRRPPRKEPPSAVAHSGVLAAEDAAVPTVVTATAARTRSASSPTSSGGTPPAVERHGPAASRPARRADRVGDGPGVRQGRRRELRRGGVRRYGRRATVMVPATELPSMTVDTARRRRRDEGRRGRPAGRSGWAPAVSVHVGPCPCPGLGGDLHVADHRSRTRA